MFDEIFDSKLSAEDKQPLRLLQEAQNFSIAGTETTSWILSVRHTQDRQRPPPPFFHSARIVNFFFQNPQIMTVHLLTTPRVLTKLRDELKVALPDVSAPLSIRNIEQLPYLSAVITEGLRLAMGTSQRQTRISPNEVMTFNDGKKQWNIPPGVSIQFPPTPRGTLKCTSLTLNPHNKTPVGMAAPLVHLNPAIFADPLEFRPERFVENPSLKRYLMTFSQGSRQCLGMQLAYTELFLMHSEIWRRFGSKEDHGEDGWWELFETDRSDADMAADRFVPYPRADSKGIRIKVCK